MLGIHSSNAIKKAVNEYQSEV